MSHNVTQISFYFLTLSPVCGFLNVEFNRTDRNERMKDSNEMLAAISKHTKFRECVCTLLRVSYMCSCISKYCLLVNLVNAMCITMFHVMFGYFHPESSAWFHDNDCFHFVNEYSCM